MLTSSSSRSVLAVVCGISFALGACSTVDKVMESRKVDYKSTSKLPPLDIPPDLSSLPKDDRFAVPDLGGRGVATASEVAGRSERRQVASGVLPESQEVRLVRSGTQRWLVVNQSPEQLWPQVREFWLANGFILKVDQPDIGVMETDWAENRAKLPQSGIRDLLGRVLDSVYSSGEMDKYRTRLERTDKGTEIYVSHRGMVEVYTSQAKDNTAWQARPADPELEAEFLGRMMVKFGATQDAAKTQLAGNAAAGLVARATLRTDDGRLRVAMTDGFDRSWRRVGLALDRVGFTVEDRDRSKGVYFVRYVDPELDRNTKTDKGFFAGIFDRSSSAEKQLKSQPKYRIVVAALEQGQGTEVAVQTNDGKPETGEVGKRILNLLQNELR